MAKKDITEIVRKVLIDHKDARDSDFRAIGWVIKATRPDAMNMTFADVLWKYKDLNLPSFETIRRTRQKLQAENPELRGEAYVKRINKQKDYIDKFVVGKSEPSQWEI